MNGKQKPSFCHCCLENNSHCVHIYDKKPPGETNFYFKNYYRELWCCLTCGHYQSTTNMNLSKLYSSDYVDNTYGGVDGIERNYQRIMALDPEKSDNVGRVKRIIGFSKKHFAEQDSIRILDIGSGLGVFLGKIKQKTSWHCTAMEPDSRLSDHAKQTIGVESICRDYRELKWNRKFDIITLNKVLEHIESPAELLMKCKDDLAVGGFIYIELPDGTSASKDKEKYGCEEFFLEHHHVFSHKSMKMLISKCGLKPLLSEAIVEPSGKYTLRSFNTF